MNKSEIENLVPNIMEDVLWVKINQDNPLYEKLVNMVRSLCEKYGVAYSDNVDDIYNKFLSKMNEKNDEKKENIAFQNELNVAESLKDDLGNCSDIETLDDLIDKYKDIHNQYRILISEYTLNSGELSNLLLNSDGSEISWEKNLEERNKPMMVSVCDEDGWPILDENGNEMARLETDEEAKQRIAEMKESLANPFLEGTDNINNNKASLSKWMEFLFVLPRLSGIYKGLGDSIYDIGEYKDKLVLDNFLKDEHFMDDLNNIMAHDTNEVEYLYHGTSCLEDAEATLSEGLYMVREELSTTTYSEFTKEQLLLYKRGWAGEIGEDAVVIIKKPRGEQIVRKMSKKERSNAHVAVSGLGFTDDVKYIIPKEYIVGYVNKRDKEVKFRPEEMSESLELNAESDTIGRKL